jgi:hypothetical protein
MVKNRDIVVTCFTPAVDVFLFRRIALFPLSTFCIGTSGSVPGETKVALELTLFTEEDGVIGTKLLPLVFTFTPPGIPPRKLACVNV